MLITSGFFYLINDPEDDGEVNIMNSKLNKTVKISLLAAIAVILMLFEIPIFPAFGWLKLDLSDVPALMGAFAFGPVAGIMIELVKNLVNILVDGTVTALVGEFANFLVGISLVVPASIIYHRNKTKKSALIGMGIGIIALEILGILANVFILLPLFRMNMTPDQLTQYIIAGLLPFNGLKGILVCGLTYILYKRVSVAIFKVEPMKSSKKMKA